jgi:hypothetical protein
MPEIQPPTPDERPALWGRAAESLVESETFQKHFPWSEVNRTATRLAEAVRMWRIKGGELSQETGFCLRHGDADREAFQALVREKLLSYLKSISIPPPSDETLDSLNNPPSEIPKDEQVQALYNRVVARLANDGEPDDDGTIIIEGPIPLRVGSLARRGDVSTDNSSVAGKVSSRVLGNTCFDPKCAEKALRHS